MYVSQVHHRDTQREDYSDMMRKKKKHDDDSESTAGEAKGAVTAAVTKERISAGNGGCSSIAEGKSARGNAVLRMRAGDARPLGDSFDAFLGADTGCSTLAQSSSATNKSCLAVHQTCEQQQNNNDCQHSSSSRPRADIESHDETMSRSSSTFSLSSIETSDTTSSRREDAMDRLNRSESDRSFDQDDEFVAAPPPVFISTFWNRRFFAPAGVVYPSIGTTATAACSSPPEESPAQEEEEEEENGSSSGGDVTMGSRRIQELRSRIASVSADQEKLTGSVRRLRARIAERSASRESAAAALLRKLSKHSSAASRFPSTSNSILFSPMRRNHHSHPVRTTTTAVGARRNNNDETTLSVAAAPRSEAPDDAGTKVLASTTTPAEEEEKEDAVGEEEEDAKPQHVGRLEELRQKAHKSEDSLRRRLQNMKNNEEDVVVSSAEVTSSSTAEQKKNNDGVGCASIGDIFPGGDSSSYYRAALFANGINTGKISSSIANNESAASSACCASSSIHSERLTTGSTSGPPTTAGSLPKTNWTTTKQREEQDNEEVSSGGAAAAAAESMSPRPAQLAGLDMEASKAGSESTKVADAPPAPHAKQRKTDDSNPEEESKALEEDGLLLSSRLALEQAVGNLRDLDASIARSRASEEQQRNDVGGGTCAMFPLQPAQMSALLATSKDESKEEESSQSKDNTADAAAPPASSSSAKEPKSREDTVAGLDDASKKSQGEAPSPSKADDSEAPHTASSVKEDPKSHADAAVSVLDPSKIYQEEAAQSSSKDSDALPAASSSAKEQESHKEDAAWVLDASKSKEEAPSPSSPSTDFDAPASPDGPASPAKEQKSHNKDATASVLDDASRLQQAGPSSSKDSDATASFVKERQPHEHAVAGLDDPSKSQEAEAPSSSKDSDAPPASSVIDPKSHADTASVLDPSKSQEAEAPSSPKDSDAPPASSAKEEKPRADTVSVIDASRLQEKEAPSSPRGLEQATKDLDASIECSHSDKQNKHVSATATALSQRPDQATAIGVSKELVIAKESYSDSSNDSYAQVVCSSKHQKLHEKDVSALDEASKSHEEEPNDISGTPANNSQQPAERERLEESKNSYAPATPVKEQNSHGSVAIVQSNSREHVQVLSSGDGPEQEAGNSRKVGVQVATASRLDEHNDVSGTVGMAPQPTRLTAIATPMESKESGSKHSDSPAPSAHQPDDNTVSARVQSDSSHLVEDSDAPRTAAMSPHPPEVKKLESKESECKDSDTPVTSAKENNFLENAASVVTGPNSANEALPSSLEQATGNLRDADTTTNAISCSDEYGDAAGTAAMARKALIEPTESKSKDSDVAASPVENQQSDGNAAAALEASNSQEEARLSRLGLEQAVCNLQALGAIHNVVSGPASLQPSRATSLPVPKKLKSESNGSDAPAPSVTTQKSHENIVSVRETSNCQEEMVSSRLGLEQPVGRSSHSESKSHFPPPPIVVATDAAKCSTPSGDSPALSVPMLDDADRVSVSKPEPPTVSKPQVTKSSLSGTTCSLSGPLNLGSKPASTKADSTDAPVEENSTGSTATMDTMDSHKAADKTDKPLSLPCTGVMERALVLLISGETGEQVFQQTLAIMALSNEHGIKFSTVNKEDPLQAARVDDLLSLSGKREADSFPQFFFDFVPTNEPSETEKVARKVEPFTVFWGDWGRFQESSYNGMILQDLFEVPAEEFEMAYQYYQEQTVGTVEQPKPVSPCSEVQSSKPQTPPSLSPAVSTHEQANKVQQQLSPCSEVQSSKPQTPPSPSPTVSKHKQANKVQQQHKPVSPCSEVQSSKPQTPPSPSYRVSKHEQVNKVQQQQKPVSPCSEVQSSKPQTPPSLSATVSTHEQANMVQQQHKPVPPCSEVQSSKPRTPESLPPTVSTPEQANKVQQQRSVSPCNDIGLKPTRLQTPSSLSSYVDIHRKLILLISVKQMSPVQVSQQTQVVTALANEYDIQFSTVDVADASREARVEQLLGLSGTREADSFPQFFFAYGVTTEQRQLMKTPRTNIMEPFTVFWGDWNRFQESVRNEIVQQDLTVIAFEEYENAYQYYQERKETEVDRSVPPSDEIQVQPNVSQTPSSLASFVDMHRELILLISVEELSPQQASQQKQVVAALVNEYNIQFTTVNFADPSKKARVEQLLGLSGKREADFPQFFFEYEVTKTTGSIRTEPYTVFWGDWHRFQESAGNGTLHQELSVISLEQYEMAYEYYEQNVKVDESEYVAVEQAVPPNSSGEECTLL